MKSTTYTQTTHSAQTYTVAELAAQIKKVLAKKFAGEMWVQGEVSNLSIARSGHAYFDITEPSHEPRSNTQPEAKIAVALFRGNRDRVDRTLAEHGNMTLKDGMLVRIAGKVDFWPQGGRLQFYMSNIDPNFTLGELEANRTKLLQLLQDEGLLHKNQSLKFPVAPLKIGLVTSASSAAQHDFCHELENSNMAWEVVLAHSLVQGADAPLLIAAAIAALSKAEVDLIAIVRGGGSRTDLMAFDHEMVARAIATAPVPVITGIGHEIDHTIADEVAHTAQKTPTACAVFLVGAAQQHLQHSQTAWEKIYEHVSLRLQAANTQLVGVSQTTVYSAETRLRTAARQLLRNGQLIRSQAESHTQQETRKVDGCTQALEYRAYAAVTSAKHRLNQMQQSTHIRGVRIPIAAAKELEYLQGQIGLLDPKAVLARGWSITRHKGKAITNPKELKTGDELETTVAAGKLRSVVSDTRTVPNQQNVADAGDTRSR